MKFIFVFVVTVLGFGFSLIHIFSVKMPLILGLVGVSMVEFAQLFPFWQCVGVSIGGYLFIGYVLYDRACLCASGRRGLIFNPAGTPFGFIVWCIAWLIIFPFELLVRQNYIRS